MERQKAVLFDLDGTLVQFQIDYKKARKVAMDIISEAGIPSEIISSDMLILKMVEIAKQYFKSGKIKDNKYKDFNQLRRAISKEVEKIERLAAEKAKVIPGMIPVLDFLLKKNIKIGIITFNTQENAFLTLTKTKLTKYFPDINQIAGRDQVQHPKPHPDHAKPLLQYFNITGENCIIIGDHPNDVETAVAIGGIGIAILREGYKPEEFNTKYILNYTDLPEKLIKILQGWIEK